MLTDQYEVTMLRAALADGTAHHRAVFEVFARRLPAGRRYGVVAGLDRLLTAVESFRFTAEHLEILRERGVVDDATAAYLADFRFAGQISAYREGEVYLPHSPVLTVEATFGEAVLLETLILSVLNHDSAVASAGARMRFAAAARILLEMGSRRTAEMSAVSAARAAYVVGFDATSNLEAGFRYGVPTIGTSAHAYVLAHRSERDAFAAQVSALGVQTSLLVDTYDTATGISTAVDVAGTSLGGVRIDSGDLRTEAFRARALLDDLGATGTRVILTGDLDEHRIAALADAPVDTYGVGTRLVTGSGAPTAEMVYKLVSVADRPGDDAPLRPVAKRSAGKASTGGRKIAHRVMDADGYVCAEVLTVDAVPSEGSRVRMLQERVVVDGVVVHRPGLDEIRDHHRRAVAELTPTDLDLVPGSPRFTARLTTRPTPTEP